MSATETIVNLRINETLQTGAVRKPHLPGEESVYLFLAFTISYWHGWAGQDAPPTVSFSILHFLYEPKTILSAHT